MELLNPIGYLGFIGFIAFIGLHAERSQASSH